MFELREVGMSKNPKHAKTFLLCMVCPIITTWTYIHTLNPGLDYVVLLAMVLDIRDNDAGIHFMPFNFLNAVLEE